MVPGTAAPLGTWEKCPFSAAAHYRLRAAALAEAENKLFKVLRKYPANRLPSPEAVKFFCKFGSRDGEVLQGKLLGRPRTPGRVSASWDLSLRESPPHGSLLLKARDRHLQPGVKAT